jgi:hypothetical protein
VCCAAAHASLAQHLPVRGPCARLSATRATRHPPSATHPQVKCTHVTEADYKRAAAGEWVKPGALPPVPASVQPLAGIPGLGGLPAFVPGLPGQAPLSIPSMLPPPGSAASHKPAYGGIPGLGAFPPPPP